MTALAAAMTMDVDYGYPDEETEATATTPEQFDGAVVVGSDWEIEPVMRVLAIEQRCAAPNWDGHDSPAILGSTGDLVIGLIRQIGAFDIQGLPQPHVGAVAAGGICFEFQHGNRELSLTVFNAEDTISYLKSGVGEPFEEEVLSFGSPTRLRELLTWLMSA